MSSTGGPIPGAAAVPHGEPGVSRWWRVVGGLMMNLALGSLYAWSVFVAPLEKEFGWKRADTSSVFGWAVVVFALSFILAGRLQDKLGPFKVSITGCILLTAGFLLSAKTDSLTWLIICFGVVFFVMTLFGALLLKNPPAGYTVPGWAPASKPKSMATTYEFSPGETLRTPTFYYMWVAYALGTFGGFMAISQLVPFAKSMKIPGEALAAITLFVGAAGNASGRILSGWMSDAMGRLNVLRLMIGISAVAMPLLYLTGKNVALLYVMVFVVYWCYGTQLSVNASTTSDFWGTKNAGINYGLLFTSWGVAGIIGPRIGGALFDRYGDYQAAFYIAAALAAVAFISELLARRPKVPAAAAQAQPAPGS